MSSPAAPPNGLSILPSLGPGQAASIRSASHRRHVRAQPSSPAGLADISKTIAAAGRSILLYQGSSPRSHPSPTVPLPSHRQHRRSASVLELSFLGPGWAAATRAASLFGQSPPVTFPPARPPSISACISLAHPSPFTVEQVTGKLLSLVYICKVSSLVYICKDSSLVYICKAPAMQPCLHLQGLQPCLLLHSSA